LVELAKLAALFGFLFSEMVNHIEQKGLIKTPEGGVDEEEPLVRNNERGRPITGFLGKSSKNKRDMATPFLWL
jgi:hypothetical protein